MDKNITSIIHVTSNIYYPDIVNIKELEKIINSNDYYYKYEDGFLTKIEQLESNNSIITVYYFSGNICILKEVFNIAPFNDDHIYKINWIFSQDYNIPGGNTLPQISSKEKKDIINAIESKMLLSGKFNPEITIGSIFLQRLGVNNFRPLFSPNIKNEKMSNDFLDMFSDI